MSVVLSEDEAKLKFTEIATGTKSLLAIDGRDRKRKGLLTQPTMDQRRLGAEAYSDTFNVSVLEGIRTRKELERDFLDKYEFLSVEDQKTVSRLKGQCKVLERQILRYKSEDALLRQKKEELFKKEYEYHSFLSKKDKFYMETAEYQAEKAEIYFYAGHCVKGIWDSPAQFKKERDTSLVSHVIPFLFSFIRGFDQGVLRALARVSSTKTRWRISSKTGAPFFGIPMQGGSSFFTGPTAYWTPDQLGLCSWLLYYDDVIQAFEAPEWLLVDDAKLDEWVHKKMKQKEADRIKKLGTSASGDRSGFDHQEVIVFDEDKDLLFSADSPYRAPGSTPKGVSDQKTFIGPNMKRAAKTRKTRAD